MSERSRTSLSPYAASMRDADPDGPTRAAKQAWLDHGILVVMPGQIHGLDKQFAEALGNRLWGKRK